MMSRQDRAKQFAPFDALKGLEEELAKRREKHTREPKREISEEMQNEISHELSRTRVGDEAEATFYHKGHYLKISGKIDQLNIVSQFLTIEGTTIFFDDISEFKII